MTDKKIADSVIDLVGRTPMIRLNRIVPGGSAEVLGKMEALEPRRQRQGPHRPQHDQGGGARTPARKHDRRADER
jgi:hypothetical protein